MNATENQQCEILSTDIISHNETLIKTQNSLKIKINSLCIALFLSIQLFNYFIGINTVVFSFIILTISVINNRRIYLNKKCMKFFVFVLAWFGVTKYIFEFGSVAGIYLIFFIAFGITSIYLCDKEFSVKKILYYMCIIYVVVAPFVLVSAITIGATMGEVYSLIIGVFALILCIFSSRFKVDLVSRIVFFSTLMVYVYKISLVSTRGVYLSLAVFLILYYIIAKANVSWKTIVLLITISILIYISYIYLYEIMAWVESIFSKMNLNINAISKSVKLLEADRFDHNRQWYYNYAIKGIKQHWWFGQGIGAFELQTGKPYVHNIILQLLFEGGIVYFLPFALILLKIPKWIFPVSDLKKDYQVLIILLISSSLVKLMFSETYIREPKFLFLLMILIIIKRK